MLEFVIGVVAILGIVLLVFSVKIVRPYQRGLVERLGRYRVTRDPGLTLVWPIIESIQLVDMREQVVDVPPQEVITQDNVVVSVDAVVYHEATDPKKLVYNVADFLTAITKLAQTNLRNLVGDLELDKALTSRDEINAKLRQVLDVATDKWGVRVVRVEIQRIDPPAEVVSAMHAQMRAERDRRATVTEANGYREAAVARASGEKEAAVLAAEGRKQAAVLDAEGEARAVELRAGAEQLRLEKVGAGEGADGAAGCWRVVEQCGFAAGGYEVEGAALGYGLVGAPAPGDRCDGDDCGTGGGDAGRDRFGLWARLLRGV